MILLFFARDFFLNFFLFLYRNKITAHQQQNDGRLVELFQEKDVNNKINCADFSNLNKKLVYATADGWIKV